MVQQAETGISLILTLGTLGMLVLGIFIVLFIVLYQKKLISQQFAHQRELLGATIQTQERERRRIAQDLHDGVGALLATAKLSINQAGKKTVDQSATGFLAEAKGLIDDTITNTRRISHDLLPATLEEFGLPDALDELCNKINTSAIEVRFSHSGEKGRFEDKTELAIFRVVQELTWNALKHAEATRIEVSCELDKNHLKVVVKDNGKGFDMGALKQRPKGDRGLGLKNIESRINMVNAAIKYETGKGKGTRVSIEMDFFGL